MSPWERLFGRCRGCEARDAEIARLGARVDALEASRAEAEARYDGLAADALAKLSAHADLRAHLATERAKAPAEKPKPKDGPVRMPLQASRLATRGHMPASKWRERGGGPQLRPREVKPELE